MSTKVRSKPRLLPDGQYNVDAEIWLICLGPELLNASHRHFVYKLAHELAHVFFRHGSLDHLRLFNAEDDCDYELEADLKTVEWGFEPEFSQFPEEPRGDMVMMELGKVAAKC